MCRIFVSFLLKAYLTLLINPQICSARVHMYVYHKCARRTWRHVHNFARRALRKLPQACSELWIKPHSNLYAMHGYSTIIAHYNRNTGHFFCSPRADGKYMFTHCIVTSMGLKSVHVLRSLFRVGLSLTCASLFSTWYGILFVCRYVTQWSAMTSKNWTTPQVEWIVRWTR